MHENAFGSFSLPKPSSELKRLRVLVSAKRDETANGEGRGREKKGEEKKKEWEVDSVKCES